MTITKPCRESKTAKRIWNKMERLSVIASTADIQVRAKRGRTTQELHKDALRDTKRSDLPRIQDIQQQILFLMECLNTTNRKKEPAVYLTPPQISFIRWGHAQTHTLYKLTFSHAVQFPLLRTIKNEYESESNGIDFQDTYMALLAVVADKAVVETTPHLAHFKVNPVWGSLICLQNNQTTQREC